jgi:hypothetical protein
MHSMLDPNFGQLKLFPMQACHLVSEVLQSWIKEKTCVRQTYSITNLPMQPQCKAMQI